VPGALFLGRRAVSPGQRQAFLDQDLANILTADIDPRQGAPIAVFAAPLDLVAPGPHKGGESLLALRPAARSRSQWER